MLGLVPILTEGGLEGQHDSMTAWQQGGAAAGDCA